MELMVKTAVWGILALGVLMVSRRSLSALILFYALQNLFLTLLAFALAHEEVHFVLAGLALFLVKGLLIPWYLLRLLDRLEISHEVESYLSVTLSLMIGGGLVFLAFHLGERFVLPKVVLPEAVPVGIALILLGMLSILIRKKALSQILGFLALENGIFVLALVESHGLPLFVELGIALDAFAAVVLSGLLMRRIKETFGHVDTSQMHSLKG